MSRQQSLHEGIEKYIKGSVCSLEKLCDCRSGMGGVAINKGSLIQQE